MIGEQQANADSGNARQALPSAGRAPSSGFFSPMNLIGVVLRRWFVVLVLTGIGGAAGFIHSRMVVPIYKAEAELEMNVRRPKVINNEAVFDDGSASNEDVIFNTRFKKFKSPAMERLATEEYFKRYPEDDSSQGGFIGRYMLAGMIRDVGWRKDGTANIVYVSYYNENPEFAAKMVNVLSHCAGLLMMQENQAVSEEAVKWLVTQLDDQRGELELVEAQLASLRDELNLDSLEQHKVSVGQALIAVSAEREALFSRISERKIVLNYVLELKGTDPDLENLPTGLPKEAELNELIANSRNARDELLLIASRYTDKHPEYKAAAEKEARAKEQLAHFIEGAEEKVRHEITLLGQQLEEKDKRIFKLKGEALDLEQQLVSGSQRQQRLERKRDAADTAYQSLLRRMEEARLSADENMAFTKIIRGAQVPRFAVNLSTSKTLLTGLFMGGAAGCVLVILLSFMLDKIESVTDLKDLGLYILGTIPSYRKENSREELATLGLRDKFNPMIEIFAGVNSLISSEKYAGNTKVLLMSSAMPGEGKTVSACNLAISSSVNGSKTLLIDCDLRRPQLAKVFEIGEEHPSLLEWLVDGEKHLSHRELVSCNIIENLDVITSRPIKEINPAELLGRGCLAELIEWAREHYDRIIIDSPPLGVVGDAQVLADLADAVVVVSRIGKTRRRALRFSLAKFEEIDAPVFGCIANDVPHSIAGMFRGAEGYGYGYGYKSYGRDEA
ncbi:polysaccharide biosynthesis tyrosine autokinase [Pontiellaceae bacterium B1224]|nr:polysaccharide biosynthesis tyrosine autokinase [Pontiellaceae bacterium B1224]